ncbi:hypothetical protein EDD18DRAFT_1105815 [Armillaria luteobubalina]|uniref:Uncharacterized protein n=1 Tax=Armillaria luteobubalina TaxID=153913 RepID=A0AA39Q4X6_9AGAR|nr:hypothetical protein EDD18DRAFT_1105815 [Armillaria luteobubalina]
MTILSTQLSISPILHPPRGALAVCPPTRKSPDTTVGAATSQQATEIASRHTNKNIKSIALDEVIAGLTNLAVGQAGFSLQELDSSSTGMAVDEVFDSHNV